MALFCLKFFLVVFLSLLIQAARIIANLLVMGSGVLGRAVVQAYRKAIESK